MSNESGQLKRSLGLFACIMLVITSVIGGGIFTVPGEVMATAQGSGTNILAWIIAGSLCILSGMVYMELGPAMPKAGGPYAYLEAAYGEGAAFVYGWFSILNFSAVLSILSFSFANYLSFFFPYSGVMIKVVASIVLLLAFTTNVCGLKLSTTVNNGLTVSKLLVLAVVIVVGAFFVKTANFQPVVNPDVGWGSSISAAVPALFAFSGYVQIVYMAEEIKNPEKNIPRALVIGIAAIIFIYIALSVISTGVLSVGTVASSDKVVAEVASVIFGKVGAVLITFGALISIYGTINSGFMSFPRIAFSMGRSGVFPKMFAKTNKKFGTPHIATLTFLIVALVLLWAGKFRDLIMMCTFVARLLTILVSSSLFVLRRKQPNLNRPLKMPGYPVTLVIVIILDITMAFLVPKQQIISGLIFGAFSIPAYFIFRHFKNKELTKQQISD